MKVFAIVLFFVAHSILPASWMLNIDEAMQVAQKEDKFVLVYFSGSDWCRPCIQMKGEIMDDSQFLNYANQHFVKVLADFPKRKKNQLSDEQTRHNEALAEKYNLEGYFPLLVVLDQNGNIVGKTGFEHIGVEGYIQKLEKFIH